MPAALEHGAGVVTFSNLCYGRILDHPMALREYSGALPAPMELYQYSLSHAGVACCLSAPSTMDQLAHNLRVLDAPTLTPERLVSLREYGAWVYQDNTTFLNLVRKR